MPDEDFFARYEESQARGKWQTRIKDAIPRRFDQERESREVRQLFILGAIVGPDRIKERITSPQMYRAIAAIHHLAHTKPTSFHILKALWFREPDDEQPSRRRVARALRDFEEALRARPTLPSERGRS